MKGPEKVEPGTDSRSRTPRVSAVPGVVAVGSSGFLGTSIHAAPETPPPLAGRSLSAGREIPRASARLRASRSFDLDPPRGGPPRDPARNTYRPTRATVPSISILSASLPRDSPIARRARSSVGSKERSRFYPPAELRDPVKRARASSEGSGRPLSLPRFWREEEGAAWCSWPIPQDPAGSRRVSAEKPGGCGAGGEEGGWKAVEAAEGGRRPRGGSRAPCSRPGCFWADFRGGIGGSAGPSGRGRSDEGGWPSRFGASCWNTPRDVTERRRRGREESNESIAESNKENKSGRISSDSRLELGARKAPFSVEQAARQVSRFSSAAVGAKFSSSSSGQTSESAAKVPRGATTRRWRRSGTARAAPKGIGSERASRNPKEELGAHRL
ncbi:hypothetical protein KM043_004100 [Ampulex compressa]|nr:hypothetical protein KM043_004100 [Ampulex compressa]